MPWVDRTYVCACGNIWHKETPGIVPFDPESSGLDGSSWQVEYYSFGRICRAVGAGEDCDWFAGIDGVELGETPAHRFSLDQRSYQHRIVHTTCGCAQIRGRVVFDLTDEQAQLLFPPHVPYGESNDHDVVTPCSAFRGSIELTVENRRDGACQRCVDSGQFPAEQLTTPSQLTADDIEDFFESEEFFSAVNVGADNAPGFTLRASSRFRSPEETASLHRTQMQVERERCIEANERRSEELPNWGDLSELGFVFGWSPRENPPEDNPFFPDGPVPPTPLLSADGFMPPTNEDRPNADNDTLIPAGTSSQTRPDNVSAGNRPAPYDSDARYIYPGWALRAAPFPMSSDPPDGGVGLPNWNARFRNDSPHVQHGYYPNNVGSHEFTSGEPTEWAVPSHERPGRRTFGTYQLQ